ncbi:MAG: DUF2189 domain-containing protein [Tabrizicola sp.]|nr:DUF2189 domain-containing protein [Tabrizicola sp.]
MTKTIGNPLSWTMGAFGSAVGHTSSAITSVGGADEAPAVVQRLTQADLRMALGKGWEDLQAFRSDVVFVCLLYPVIGAVLIGMAVQGNLLHLLFPVLSGFALAGPVAAVGLYEMSRRRERGEPVSWLAYLDVLRSPKFGAIITLGLFHVVLFMVWIMVANLIHGMTIGGEAPLSAAEFFRQVLTTPAGWSMIVIGMAVGFVFALVVLAVSVVSFPMILDRDVSLPVAVATSVRVARENPVVIGTWGLIVAVSLAVGSALALIGLVLVLPLLGHATWHLYRAAVR